MVVASHLEVVVSRLKLCMHQLVAGGGRGFQVEGLSQEGRRR